jgi:hypothetical protein
MTKRILFYITGHGFGHTLRSIEVMNSLKQKYPSLQLYIRTTAPAWLFRTDLFENDHFKKIEIDIGAVQNSSFMIDKEQTYFMWERLISKLHTIQSEEVEFIDNHKINLIISDIPPLAFRIASKANVLSVALGNFGWDCIYETWIAEKPQYRKIVNMIRRDYAKASILLRLPGHEPMSFFKKIQDIPLIARFGKKDVSAIREEIGVGFKKKVLLLALPDIDKELIPWNCLTGMKDFLFLSPFSDVISENILTIKRDANYFPEMINACDVVISKPGYGIIADCYANRTPLLYILRRDFQEDYFLINWAKKNMKCTELKMNDFLSGKWEKSIRRLIHGDGQWASMDVDGADVAADRILQLLGVNK